MALSHASTTDAVDNNDQDRGRNTPPSPNNSTATSAASGPQQSNNTDADNGTPPQTESDTFRNVYVSNIPLNLTSIRLRELFSVYGRIVSTKILRDSKTNQSKGIGFVFFANDADGKKAIESLANDGLLNVRAAHPTALPNALRDGGSKAPTPATSPKNVTMVTPPQPKTVPPPPPTAQSPPTYVPPPPPPQYNTNAAPSVLNAAIGAPTFAAPAPTTVYVLPQQQQHPQQVLNYVTPAPHHLVNYGGGYTTTVYAAPTAAMPSAAAGPTVTYYHAPTPMVQYIAPTTTTYVTAPPYHVSYGNGAVFSP